MRDVALRARIATVSELGGRVYAVAIPLDTALPAAAYQLVASEPAAALDGDVYVSRTWRVVVHADAVAAARNIARNIAATLNFWQDRAEGVELCRVTDVSETVVDYGDGSALVAVLTVQTMEVMI